MQQLTSIKEKLAQAKKASRAIRQLTDSQKVQVLRTLSDLLMAHQEEIIQENQKDLVRMEDNNPKKDRLKLTPKRIQNLVFGVNSVATLPDPTGVVLLQRHTQAGLQIDKISVPLGVVGIIYESRPNVTIDVVSLCIRSGNAVVLRGGSDAYYSNVYLVKLVHEALKKHDLPESAVSLLPTEREFVAELLTADKYIDILIPRGSKQLIDYVRQHASVPTIETGAGVCHTYVHKEANLEMASNIVINAKVSRPSVCNALDTILVDREIASLFLPSIMSGLSSYDVDIYADEEGYDILKAHNYPYLHHASEEDYGREFLSYGCSLKVIENLEEALEHIDQYSSKHSEAIVSENRALCNHFLKAVDAAAVYANASTRFTDGAAFGLGAEIGISTQKLHARGPFALEKLVTEKWIIRGSGQVR